MLNVKFFFGTTSMIMSRLLTVVLMSLWVTSILESLLDHKGMNIILAHFCSVSRPFMIVRMNRIQIIFSHFWLKMIPFSLRHFSICILNIKLHIWKFQRKMATIPLLLNQVIFLLSILLLLPSQVKISLNTLNLILTFLFHLDTTHL